MATIIKILRVDMRANDPKVIQGELQEQVDAIGKEGYKKIKKYDWKHLWKEYEVMYK